MVRRRVTIDTKELVSSDVDVIFLEGVGERGVDVPVLHGLSAATVRMAAETVLTTRCPHRAGRGQEIGLGRRSAARPLHVGIRPLVADETIDVLPIGEVERIVYPAEAGVAFGAASFVSANGQAEVVQNVLLAKARHTPVVPGDGSRFAEPEPVRALHHLGRVWMTTQTRARHRLGALELGTEQRRMVQVGADPSCPLVEARRGGGERARGLGERQRGADGQGHQQPRGQEPETPSGEGSLSNHGVLAARGSGAMRGGVANGAAYQVIYTAQTMRASCFAMYWRVAI